MPFYVLFIIFPLMELWAFVEVCGEIGFITAVLLLIASALIGGALVRYQGFQTVLAMHDSFDRGRIPAGELFDGFCIVAAGVLLIAPGFITDILAVLLLVPRLRGLLKSFLRRQPGWTTADSGIIEGEYERIEDEPPALRDPESSNRS
ncbi:MAG: FxsA family protein [Alphaproteobacteria bacterium PRO2]|nr:FxsA family protein [Alphaproteobacteria bacterium PRO2]